MYDVLWCCYIYGYQFVTTVHGPCSMICCHLRASLCFVARFCSTTPRTEHWIVPVGWPCLNWRAEQNVERSCWMQLWGDMFFDFVGAAGGISSEYCIYLYIIYIYIFIYLFIYINKYIFAYNSMNTDSFCITGGKLHLAASHWMHLPVLSGCWIPMLCSMRSLTPSSSPRAPPNPIHIRHHGMYLWVCDRWLLSVYTYMQTWDDGTSDHIRSHNMTLLCPTLQYVHKDCSHVF